DWRRARPATVCAAPEPQARPRTGSRASTAVASSSNNYCPDAVAEATGFANDAPASNVTATAARHNRRPWASEVASRARTRSKNSGNPAFDARLIGRVLGAEDLCQPRLVLQHTAMKPPGAAGQQKQSEPRPERECHAEQEDEMPEIHWVAREAIRPLRDDP